jgi:hypothetical protein
MKTGIVVGVGLLVRLLCSAIAADSTLKVADKEPPKDVGESIRKALQPKAVQLFEGDKAAYEFWFRNEVPLKAKAEAPSKGLQAVGEMTFLGVAMVGEHQRDYKDNEIAPGTYTIRFGLQPQDGDHLGTAEFPYFAVLIPAKSDTEVDGIRKFKVMAKASGKATATGHPVVLSLRPPSSEDSPTPTLTSPTAGLKAVRLRLEAKALDSDQAGSIVFELVYEGKYKT